MGKKLESATWNLVRDGNDVLMDYMDGQPWLLEPGKDYQSLTAVRAALYKLAKAYDLRVQTRTRPDGLQIRFIRLDGTEYRP